MFRRQGMAGLDPVCLLASGRSNDVRSATISIIAAAMAVVALAGCDGGNGAPGTPGSATVSVHGRVESNIGGSLR
jgi:hypothetical protein